MVRKCFPGFKTGPYGNGSVVLCNVGLKKSQQIIIRIIKIAGAYILPQTWKNILYEKLPHSQFLTWNSGRIYAPAKYSYGTKYLNPNSSKLTLRISEICIGYNFWNLLTLFCQIHIRSTHMIFYQERNQNLCDKPAICKVLQRYWKNW